MGVAARHLAIVFGLSTIGCLPPSGGGARIIGGDADTPTSGDSAPPVVLPADAQPLPPPIDRGVLPDIRMPPPPPPPIDASACMPESCNGRDDDCDGFTDEGLAAEGEPCQGFVGRCERAGTRVCEDGELRCIIDEGVEAETCNGRDDDCDGAIDEAVRDVGGACIFEVQRCELPGARVCRQGALVCEATNPPPVEMCNRQDEDCDGRIDEEVPQVGEACAVDIDDGRCVGRGRFVCTRGTLTCDVERVDRPDESCNGRDDDCDGEVDEDAVGVGRGCVEGVGGCARAGEFVCSEGGLVCNVAAGRPRAEFCNNRDDDCDGAVDEDDVCVVPDAGPPEPDAAPPPPEFELFGVHNDVNADVLLRAGFRFCYESQYNNWIEAEEVAARCQGRHIAMACVNINEAGDVWPHDLDVVAMGRRDVVFRRTDCNPQSSWVSNGVQWYASAHCSMGFAPADAPLNRARCDRGAGFSNQRVCWATNWETGDRCGAARDLDESGIHVRMVFVRD